MNSKSLIITILLACAVTAQAQENDSVTFERDVRIEREYVPEFEAAKRPNFNYTVQDYDVTKGDLVYSSYTSQVQPESQFYPLKPQTQNVLTRKPAQRGYAKIAAGYPLNWCAELFYPIFKEGDDTQLNIYLNNNGIWSKNYIKKGDKQYIQLIETDADISFSQKMGDHQLFANVGYENDFFSYYGDSQINTETKYALADGGNIMGDKLFFNGKSIKFSKKEEAASYDMQSFHRAKALIGMRSLKAINKWNYNAALQYNMFLMQYSGLNEHDINAFVGINRMFGKDELDAQINFRSNFYSIGNSDDPRFVNDGRHNNAVLELKPAYTLHFSKMDLRLGVNVWFLFLKKDNVAASPDVRFDYHVLKFMDIYAGATGSYELTNLSTLTRICRYYDPYTDPEKNTYTPIDAYIGMKFKPVEGLLIDLWARYLYVNNDVMFAMNGFKEMTFVEPENEGEEGKWQKAELFTRSNTMTAYLASYHCFKPGARISYNYKDQYLAFAAFEYAGARFSEKNIEDGIRYFMHRPKVKLWTGFEARPTKELVVKADFYMGYLYTTADLNYKMVGDKSSKWGKKTYENVMPNIYDLNLSASYNITKQVAIFAQANNILSAAEKLRYQRWFDYDNIGFNCLVGIKATF